MKRLSLSLPCEFTEDELAVKAKELSLATLELREVEEQKAEVSKSFTERIKDIRSRMSQLAKEYKARGEKRLVDCIVKFNQPEPLQKTTIRLDTGEVVKVEPMTDEERQEKLFEEHQEEQAVVDDVVARMLQQTGTPVEEIDPVPPHEDTTSGEYEPNEDESEGSGQ